MQGQTQQAQDPNAFLRQMQLQYQQVPGNTTRPIQQVPILMQQQTQLSAPTSAPIQLLQSTRKTSTKRESTDIRPPAAPKSNVVSCSDTDGETRTSRQSSKKGKTSRLGGIFGKGQRRI
jgi:hypothetical protein